MKPDEKSLLRDVFVGATPKGLRDAMLRETLTTVRRRNKMRRIRNAGGTFLALVMTFFLWMRQTAPHQANRLIIHTSETPGKYYLLVRSQPLSAAEIVTTTHLANETMNEAEVAIQIVHTVPNGFRVISDQELLALIAPRPCALVRLGPNSERLIFLDAEDARGGSTN